MILTLVTRTVIDVYSLYLLLRRGEMLTFVLTLGMDAIAFVFIGWCLAVIGNADGERIVLGMTVVSFMDPVLSKL
jgi:CRP-like cAMP-binding protein